MAHDETHQDQRAEKPEDSLRVRSYLPEIAKGLLNTLRHLLYVPAFTYEYPARRPGDVVHTVREGYRGEHYLKRDPHGRVRCVACYMCATACPARCIHLEAAPAPPEWKDRDKYPTRFEIDLLRCIYCGMCEEACPVDAIALSKTFNVVAETRAAKIYHRDKLLELGDREERGKSLTPLEGARRGPWNRRQEASRPQTEPEEGKEKEEPER